MHGATTAPGIGVPFVEDRSYSSERIVKSTAARSRRTALALESGRKRDERHTQVLRISKPGRPFFNETPNFFEYSSSNPAPREFRITKKSRVGARRLITSAPLSQRSSAAMCADYTCFPAGSRRRTPFTFSPAPRCGVRYNIAVRCNSASLTLLPSSGRFRAGYRRVQSLKRTVGPGSVFDIPAKPGVVKPGFF